MQQNSSFPSDVVGNIPCSCSVSRPPAPKAAKAVYDKVADLIRHHVDAQRHHLRLRQI